MASPTPPSISSTTTESRVSSGTIERAVKALLKWKESQTKSQKPQLLPQDDFMYLILTLKKVPPKGGRANPHKIPLPHPFLENSSFAEICLIIDDRPHTKLTSDFAKKKIKSEDIPVTKVLKLSKLKSDYRPFEAKRKLCDSYDLFLADKRVVPLLPKLLGKHFFKKKKLPLPVNLTHMNWKEQIERACSSALLYMRTGTCSVVRVGKLSMESGEIVENVAAAIHGVVEVVPKKWAGLRSLHLKLSESLSLPIYQVLPDMKLKIEGIKNNLEGVTEEGDGESVVKEKKKKDDKLGKKKGSKKGRIHEVRYMDASADENEMGSKYDEDYNECEKSKDVDLGSSKFVRKKRKKGDFAEGTVLNELNGDKPSKKIGKVEKRGINDGEDDNKPKKSENGDLGSAGCGSKKKKKRDSMKGLVLTNKNGGKRATKISKLAKGDGEEQKKGGLALEGSEESGGKKGKKNSELGKMLKKVATDLKVKESKKKQSVE